MRVEKARLNDAPQIHQLVNYFANRGEMLPRALSETYENIRDFLVCREGTQVVACVALHISWSDLAEVKSLAVAEDKQHQGLGSSLVKACISEARELGVATIFCLTYKPDLFEKLGFHIVDKAQLPRKVWSECYRCPKFPNCDEIALVLDASGTGTEGQTVAP